MKHGQIRSQIIAHPGFSKYLKTFDMDICESQDQLLGKIRSNTYALGLLPLSWLSGAKLLECFQDRLFLNQNIKLIIDCDLDLEEATSQKLLFDVQNILRPTYLVNLNKETDLETLVLNAWESAQSETQSLSLSELIQGQTTQLQKLRADLEAKVLSRQASLIEIKEENEAISKRLELLSESLLAIQKAPSIDEIEYSLLGLLKNKFNLDTVKICFAPLDVNYREYISALPKAKQHISVPIFRNSDPLGSIFFVKSDDIAFEKAELDLFDRIAEGVSLSLDGIAYLEEASDLKRQWQVTFNAVKEPIIIIDQSYRVLQKNTAADGLASAIGNSNVNLCHQFLFNKPTPCDGCKLGKSFSMSLFNQRDQQSHYDFDISAQRMSLKSDNEDVYVHQYTNVTEKKKIERQLLEKSRLAELGTIGSSIAHELNNPLGGILSFVQLIKMEMTSADPLFEDLIEIENGVRRCRDIIENLLKFSRNPRSSNKEEFAVKTEIEKAIKILEIQTRAKGISILLEESTEGIENSSSTAKLFGRPQLFVQAITHLIQHFVDRNSNSAHSTKNLEISVRIIPSKENITIQIADNVLADQGPNFRPNSMHMSIARQILSDIDGKVLETLAQGTFYGISVQASRPVF